ncbi:hypothetical protein B0T19DRAFT_437672 [Cercophora scortea]|uniref:HMG box domain-containing protein n=1 Tax=Cercophora scortea TaxID=314031 RepID=A0AAE0J4U1_9PEZI|nr:hypothetical protein B0T19DRAFT_437672 [Cercophora scortea]
MADEIPRQIRGAIAAIFDTLSDQESESRKKMVSLLDPATVHKLDSGMSLDPTMVEKIIATVDPETALKMDTPIDSTYFVEQTALFLAKLDIDTRQNALTHFNSLSSPRGRGQHRYILDVDANFWLELHPDVREFLCFELGKNTGHETTGAVDGADNSIVVLGPKAILEPNIIEIDGERIWDPKGLHSQLEKIPRPPNAFILYRKDKHAEIKEIFPGIHNNEISVMIGSMWRQESPEVRANYHDKSQMIKANLMAIHPEYRYKPRKSSQIKRRGSKILLLNESPETSGIYNHYQRPTSVIDDDDEKVLRRRFPGITKVRVKSRNETEITQRIAGTKTERITLLRDWAPRLVPPRRVPPTLPSERQLHSQSYGAVLDRHVGQVQVQIPEGFNAFQCFTSCPEPSIPAPELMAMDMTLVEETNIDSIVENWDQHLAAATEQF